MFLCQEYIKIKNCKYIQGPNKTAAAAGLLGTPISTLLGAFAGSASSFQWTRIFGMISSTKPTRAPLLQAIKTRGKPRCRAYSLAFLKK